MFLKNRLFDRVVESFNRFPEMVMVSPSITVHTVLMQVLCEKGGVDAAHKMLDEMPNEGE